MENFHIINLSAYVSPRIIEQKNKGWVEYSDKGNEYRNNYFQYLIDRCINSPTNGAIINGISRLVYGKGLASTNASTQPEEWAKFRGLLKDEDIRRVIFDRKCLGMAAFQVTKRNGKIESITHFPMQTLRPEICNEDGEIEAWYYHSDWEDIRPADEPERIPAWGFGGKTGNEIYVIKRYVTGFHYFSPVEYKGGLPYAVLEEEIGDFLINDVKNHFSGTKVVNFNNGNIPDEEERRITANKVKQKLTGSTGQRVIVSFNSNAENATTVEDIPLDNAPDHYQYLADECFRKLIVAHGVTSPMLLGIREGNDGLGNNADEIQNATFLMDSTTIKPLQMEILAAIEEIINEDGYSFDLYFKTLKPVEFTTPQEKAADTNLCTHLSEDERKDFTDDEGEEMLEILEGETIDDDWELVDVRECKEDNEPIEAWAKRLIKVKENLFQKLASIIKSYPNEPSSLDSSVYKVRYTYREKYSSGNSREFCRKMMSRTDRGVVYRKEDIDMASFQGVNMKFGHRGLPYSLFKYKGGVNCGHFWQEELYRLKKKTNGEYYEDKGLASSERVNSIPADEYKPNAETTAIADKAPKDMPRNGHHPNYTG
jgi:hypothetical protein